MTSTYHTPTDRERRFLRVLAHGHPELTRQVESCEITDYDPTGYYGIRVLDGPPVPQPAHSPIDGPAVTGHPTLLYFDVLLWTNERGLLYSIEILEFRGDGTKYDGSTDPVEIYLDAAEATPPRLRYPTRS